MCEYLGDAVIEWILMRMIIQLDKQRSATRSYFIKDDEHVGISPYTISSWNIIFFFN